MRETKARASTLAIVGIALVAVWAGCGTPAEDNGGPDLDSGLIEDTSDLPDTDEDEGQPDDADPRADADATADVDLAEVDTNDADVADADDPVLYNPRFRRLGRLAQPSTGGAVTLSEYRLALSADASCVVFTTQAHAALVAGAATSDQYGVYAFDLTTDSFERLDLEADGSAPLGEEEPRLERGSKVEVLGRGEGGRRVVSGDCGLVAFTSSLDLTPTAIPNSYWSYIRDRTSGQTVRASFDEGHNGPSVISADGNRVFFIDHVESRDGGPPWVSPSELWMWDRAQQSRTWVRPTDETIRVTPATDLHASRDGRVVSFLMAARPNISTLCPAGRCVVRVEPDTSAAEVVLADVDRGNSSPVFAMSHDGARFVIKTSADLLDLVPESSTTAAGLYWYDLANDDLRLLNPGADGLPLRQLGVFFDVNGDGRYVVFSHKGTEAIAGGGPPSNGALYRYDADTDTRQLLNVNAEGVYDPNPTDDPFVSVPTFSGLAIDGSGNVVVFHDAETSGSSNGLVPGYADEQSTNLFIWDGR